MHKLFGNNGKSSIRGGYGIYFDHFGEGIIDSFDRQGTFGLTTHIVNPAGFQDVDTTARFTIGFLADAMTREGRDGIFHL